MENTLFTRKFLVHSYHTDMKGQLSLPALFSFFQEIAWEHAKEYQFGYEDLKDQGLFWVLSRVHIEINELPNWTETLNIETWPSGVDGLFALRDYRVYNVSGQNIITATSSWLILDMNTHRPRRPDVLRDNMPIIETQRATSYNAQRIQSSTESILSFEHKASICNIDVNGHINNTKYIEWAINSFSELDYKKLQVKQIEVNYISEGFLGDLCQIKINDVKSSKIIEITRESDSKQLAMIRINYQ